nr:hypothetical protein [uncultured Methanoregula sp.]
MVAAKKGPAKKKTSAVTKKNPGKKAPAKCKTKAKEPVESPAKMGRPTKYDPEFHPYAAWMLAIRGKTNIEIADGLSISTATLDSWQNLYPDFLSVLQAGKGVANAKVEQALFKAATGYDFDFTEITKDETCTTTKTGKKHVPPNIGAIKLWLINRTKDWRDKQVMEHEGEVKLTDARELLARKLDSLAARTAKTPADQ